MVQVKASAGRQGSPEGWSRELFGLAASVLLVASPALTGKFSSPIFNLEKLENGDCISSSYYPTTTTTTVGTDCLK